jgi:hypothetical protein
MTPKWQSCCAPQSEARLRQGAAVSERFGCANAYGFGGPRHEAVVRVDNIMILYDILGITNNLGAFHRDSP